jgi:hypothetical protein
LLLFWKYVHRLLLIASEDLRQAQAEDFISSRAEPVEAQMSFHPFAHYYFLEDLMNTANTDPDGGASASLQSNPLQSTSPQPLEFVVVVAGEEHYRFAEHICRQIEESAKARGTGIAKRKPEYIIEKMREGKAVIALTVEDEPRFAGFCYIEAWGGKQYVANSGLIVVPTFREGGLAKRIKHAAFALSRQTFPDAKIFSITTSHAVMKMNTELGYVPVPFSELTQDDTFWDGCSSCPNYDVLTRTNRKMCICTGMLYDPDAPKQVIQIDIPAFDTPPAGQQSSDAQAVPNEHNPLANHPIATKISTKGASTNE